MQEKPQEDQTLQQDFDLDKYRNLLERLQTSKRDAQRLAKKLPNSGQQ